MGHIEVSHRIFIIIFYVNGYVFYVPMCLKYKFI